MQKVSRSINSYLNLHFLLPNKTNLIHPPFAPRETTEFSGRGGDRDMETANGSGFNDDT